MSVESEYLHFYKDKVLIETELIKFILNPNINSCPLERRFFHQQIGRDFGGNIAQRKA